MPLKDRLNCSFEKAKCSEEIELVCMVISDKTACKMVLRATSNSRDTLGMGEKEVELEWQVHSQCQIAALFASWFRMPEGGVHGESR